jgi:hypothetical protein
MYFSNEASNRVECLQSPENRGPYIDLIENRLNVVGIGGRIVDDSRYRTDA